MSLVVFPAQAGIQIFQGLLDPRLRGEDNLLRWLMMTQNHVTACLVVDEIPNFLENFDGLLARNDWKFRHLWQCR